jgi:hypothetical protein
MNSLSKLFYLNLNVNSKSIKKSTNLLIKNFCAIINQNNKSNNSNSNSNYQIQNNLSVRK